MKVVVWPRYRAHPIGRGITIVDATADSKVFQDLSPFRLVASPYAKNFENLWQYSKVYQGYEGSNGEPSTAWYDWRAAGWADKRARRYPMGKGAAPLYSWWDGVGKLSYVEARKRIYAPMYAKYVEATTAYRQLYMLYRYNDVELSEPLNSSGEPLWGSTLVLLDYDGYDHASLGMTLKDVINNSNRRMGHSFVLAMMLEGVLEDCVDG